MGGFGLFRDAVHWGVHELLTPVRLSLVEGEVGIPEVLLVVVVRKDVSEVSWFCVVGRRVLKEVDELVEDGISCVIGGHEWLLQGKLLAPGALKLQQLLVRVGAGVGWVSVCRDGARIQVVESHKRVHAELLKTRLGRIGRNLAVHHGASGRKVLVRVAHLWHRN